MNFPKCGGNLFIEEETDGEKAVVCINGHRFEKSVGTLPPPAAYHGGSHISSHKIRGQKPRDGARVSSIGRGVHYA